jgi:hypothetical protein
MKTLLLATDDDKTDLAAVCSALRRIRRISDRSEIDGQ